MTRTNRDPWRWPAAALAVCVGLALMVVIGAGLVLRSSLPKMDGRVVLEGLGAPVRVDRDAAGVPTIRGTSRADVARALGFVHAQERFFQMDLMRRRAAGRMAELFGPAALSWDTRVRAHRLTEVARTALHESDPVSRAILEAYAEGVNAGLNDLEAPPFEYLVLRARAEPWRPEDSMAVILSMFLQLNPWTGERDLNQAALRDVLPEAVAAFLITRGTELDAPMVGPVFETPPVPGPEVIDFRSGSPASRDETPIQDVPVPGSNGWALAGSRTRHGGAILAGDMHLGLMVPNTCFRARLIWPSGTGADDADVTGVTLPGTPFVVAGSNGRVAWSFTNSQGNWVDAIPVEPLGLFAYVGPNGPEEYERWTETILVAGGDPVQAEYQGTVWGPIVAEDHRHRPVALRWTAHRPGAVGLGLAAMERASTVAEALEVGALAGVPPQNLMAAGADGSIGWSIAGRIPVRESGPDGAPETWTGWVPPEDYPRIVNPPSGQVWTANARVVDGPELDLIGEGGYMLGARAAQIRDDLLAVQLADESDLLQIQLDDRAVFLQWWRTLLLETLDPAALDADSRRAELREVVADWSGRASIDDAGYRMVRAFRVYVRPLVLDPFFAACAGVEGPCGWEQLGQREGPVRRLLTERPAHLLNPSFDSWRDLCLAAADRVIAEFTADGSTLAAHPWGERNIVAIRHPLSPFLPRWLGRFLDMEPVPLPGDFHMPRVQSPTFGASERFVVSPGREAEGFFHMPCGQSGHPLAPHYRSGHQDWVKGRPTPFLPGPPEWTLTLGTAEDR